MQGENDAPNESIVLIVKAVLEMMETDDRRETPLDFRETFTSPSGVLVKGIVFFGTPFKGSFLADLTKPLAALLRRDTSLLSRLRREDKQIKAMLSRFDELRLRRENNIPLVIFHEKKPVSRFLLKFKVTPNSHSPECKLILRR